LHEPSEKLTGRDDVIPLGVEQVPIVNRLLVAFGHDPDLRRHAAIGVGRSRDTPSGVYNTKDARMPPDIRPKSRLGVGFARANHNGVHPAGTPGASLSREILFK
jgi:hypothetical protein